MGMTQTESALGTPRLVTESGGKSLEEITGVAFHAWHHPGSDVLEARRVLDWPGLGCL